MSGFRVGAEETIGSGVLLRLQSVALEAPDGSRVRRDVVRHPGGVGILPVIGSDVILVRQYRVAVETELLEIPAGKLDRADEKPEDAARRELVEELGYTAEHLTSLGTLLPSPGYTDEVIHLFVATGIVAETDRRPDGAEERHAESIRLGLEEARSMIGSGVITDAKTQIALLRWTTARSRN